MNKNVVYSIAVQVRLEVTGTWSAIDQLCDFSVAVSDAGRDDEHCRQSTVLGSDAVVLEWR
jgi:hypothetical protein